MSQFLGILFIFPVEIICEKNRIQKVHITYFWKILNVLTEVEFLLQIVASLFVVAVTAGPVEPQARILRQDAEVNPDGSFRWA